MIWRLRMPELSSAASARAEARQSSSFSLVTLQRIFSLTLRLLALSKMK
jgi:hypothetical protein